MKALFTSNGRAASNRLGNNTERVLKCSRQTQWAAVSKGCERGSENLLSGEYLHNVSKWHTKSPGYSHIQEIRSTNCIDNLACRSAEEPLNARTTIRLFFVEFSQFHPYVLGRLTDKTHFRNGESKPHKYTKT